MKSAGLRRHPIALYTPGPSIPDGDGGFTETWVALSPSTAFAAIESATARNMERLFANTIIASATHLVTLPYLSGLSVSARLVFGTRSFSVVGIQNPEERNIELIVACVEMVGVAPVVPLAWIQPNFVQSNWVTA